ncbi:phosphatidate cytidylyltransferase [Chloroflexota bacterium]
MFIKRLIASLVMAAIGIPAIMYGGLFYFLLIGFFLLMASWEYVKIFETSRYVPSMVVTVGGVFVILISRSYFPGSSAAVLTGLILLAMTVHLLSFERGRDQAASDFAITLGGILYLGWLGAYLIDLRSLPNGHWWFFLTLGSVWVADSAAYFIGGRFGRHKLSPRLSPKKSWEGYIAGVIFGTTASIGLALAFQSWGGLQVLWWQGGLLGLVLSVFTTLGDLGESMIKRQAGVKDSSSIIPGHGGFLDRIDAWLWAGAIGFFIINWFFIA